MDVRYFIKEHLWMSTSDEATLTKIFGGSKPSPKLTLKTKWYHSCCCGNNSRSCEQLKKCATDKNILEKKLHFEPKSPSVTGKACYQHMTGAYMAHMYDRNYV